MFKKIKDRLNLIKKFKQSKSFLGSGFFYLFKHNFRKAVLRDFIHLNRIVYVKKHKSNFNILNGSFFFGAHKQAIISGNLVYIYYLEEKSFLKFLNVKKNFLELLPYKTASIVECNNGIVLLTKVSGDEISGVESQYNFLKFLILKQSRSESIKYIDGQYFSVQHGDCTSRNARVENEDYIFFDLDDIGYYPVLYDFFYCLISYNFFLKKDLNLYLLEFETDIVNFANKLKLNNGYPIDYFLSKFVAYLYKKSFKNFNRLTYWKETFDFEKYPQTSKLFETIGNNF